MDERPDKERTLMKCYIANSLVLCAGFLLAPICGCATEQPRIGRDVVAAERVEDREGVTFVRGSLTPFTGVVEERGERADFIIRTEMKNGVLHGVKEIEIGGKIVSSVEYRNGVVDGFERFLDKDGVFFEGISKGKKRVGVWEAKSEDGTLLWKELHFESPYASARYQFEKEGVAHMIERSICEFSAKPAGDDFEESKLAVMGKNISCTTWKRPFTPSFHYYTFEFPVVRYLPEGEVTIWGDTEMGIPNRKVTGKNGVFSAVNNYVNYSGFFEWDPIRLGGDYIVYGWLLDGRLNGVIRVFSRLRAIDEGVRYRMGEPIEVWRGVFRDGVVDGPAIKFDRGNGRRIAQCMFRNGKLDGLAIEYDPESGAAVKTSVFKDGELLREVTAE